MKINTIHTMDCLEGLRHMADGIVNTCVTSPPYFNLRDYNVAGQIGLEETPEIYIAKLVEIFREVKRVLRDDGTLWVNIGDSYASHGKNRTEKQATAGSNIQGSLASQKQSLTQKSKITGDLKPKDLIGIPWMLAFALRADGWYLRQDIIWSKPNCMPESVTDRCTKSHEYIFLLSKSSKYHFDNISIQQDAVWDVDGTGTLKRKQRQQENNKSFPSEGRSGIRKIYTNGKNSQTMKKVDGKRNKRSVWSVSPAMLKEAHFATFPHKLIIDCIKAGCPIGGLTLDPFMGAGTTAIVANRLERNFIGFELNAAYVAIANKRLHNEFGLFNLAV